MEELICCLLILHRFFPSCSFVWLLCCFWCACAATIEARKCHSQADDRKILRHTISVNLNILEGELEELLKVEPSAQVASADYDRARELLALSAQGAAYARARLMVADEAQLQELLGIVFAAMSRSTEARRLLKQLR